MVGVMVLLLRACLIFGCLFFGSACSYLSVVNSCFVPFDRFDDERTTFIPLFDVKAEKSGTHDTFFTSTLVEVSFTMFYFFMVFET